ncbi:hypothetical protein BJ165DRAFT_1514478, partial [Panaeolus papilionaceus]
FATPCSLRSKIIAPIFSTPQQKSTPQHSTHCASDPPPAVTAKSANTQRPLPNGDNF